MKLKSLMTACAILSASAGAWATGMGVRLGSTGVGVDFAVPVDYVPGLSARFGVSGLNMSRNVSATDVNYEGTLKLANASLLLDWNWNPLGILRLTGGLVYANNRVDVLGRSTGGSYTINGQTYPASAVSSLSGSIASSNKVAPYLGLGWGTVVGKGIGFYGDVGVLFQGQMDADMSAECGKSLGTAECAQLQVNVRKEADALRDSAKGFKYWPVINMGITIGF